MSSVVHAIDIKDVTTKSLIGLALGLVLALVPVSSLVGIVIVIIGLLMIITNGYKLYVDMNNKQSANNETLVSVVGILLGFILLCYSNIVVNIIVAIYLVAEPVVKVLLAKDKKLLINEAPKIMLGVVLLVSGISTFDIVFKLLGIIVIACSLLYLGFNYYLYKKSGVKVIK